jgi:hypothetical protein
VVAVMFGFMLAVYVVMPLIFVLFYGGSNVKATFEAADPSMRWTDRCPLPVLATAIMLGACGAWMLVYGVSYAAFPLFGKVLYGAAARAAIGVFAVAMLLLALGMLRLRTTAWWGSLILYAATGLSSVITFSRIDMMEMMTKMGLSEAELKPVRDFNFMGGGRMAWWIAVWLILWTAWLLYLRRYFGAAKKSG